MRNFRATPLLRCQECSQGRGCGQVAPVVVLVMGVELLMSGVLVSLSDLSSVATGSGMVGGVLVGSGGLSEGLVHPVWHPWCPHLRVRRSAPWAWGGWSV